MADAEVRSDGMPSLGWSTSGPDFDIEVDEGEEKTPEEIAAEEEASRRQQELLENANIGKQVAEGLSQLGMQLTETQKQNLEAMKALKPEEDPDATKQQQRMLDKVVAEIGDNYYDNPADSTAKIVRAIVQDELGPVLQRMAGVVTETANETGRAKVSQDPAMKLVMEKYSDEITSEVSKLPPGPSAYSQAARIVAANHLSEIVQAQVQAAMEESKSEKDPGNESFSEAGASASPRVAASPRPKVKISKDQLEKDKRWALNQGLDWEYAKKQLYGETVAKQISKQEGR